MTVRNTSPGLFLLHHSNGHGPNRETNALGLTGCAPCRKGEKALLPSSQGIHVPCGIHGSQPEGSWGQGSLWGCWRITGSRGVVKMDVGNREVVATHFSLTL